MRIIIGDMVKNNCYCEKNNRQNVHEYKNRIIGRKKGIIYQGLLRVLAERIVSETVSNIESPVSPAGVNHYRSTK